LSDYGYFLKSNLRQIENLLRGVRSELKVRKSYATGKYI